MKKIIFILIFIFYFVSLSNAASIVYRLSSGEVLTVNESPIGYPPNYFGFVTDTIAPDGLEIYDSENNRRILGYAKIYSGGVFRNATQEEIDTFLPAAIDDKNQKEANRAIEYFQNDPRFRRVMIAFASIIVDEINILRSEHGLPDRTLEQLKTAIQNRISKDD